MKPLFLTSLVVVALGSCALEVDPAEPAAAGQGGAGTAGAAGAATGGKGSGGNGGRAGSGDMGGDDAGGSSGDGNGGDGSGGTAAQGTGGTSGEGGAAGDDSGGTNSTGGSAGTSGSAGAGTAGTSGSGGTGGTNSTGGSAGAGTAGTSGTAGAGGSTSGPDTPIQEIQNGTVATGAQVTVQRVWVTGVRRLTNGTANISVQEPQGATVSGVTYPAYAGVVFFAVSTEAAVFPDVGLAAVGDCVSFAGTVNEFQSRTEVLTPTAFTRLAPTDCGTFPTPYAATLAALATDADGASAGDQPGPSSEMYEDVLVTISSQPLLVSSLEGNGNFRVNGGGAPNLLVEGYYYDGVALPTVAVNTSVTELTGVYYQLTNFRISPRSAADLSF